MSDKWQDYADSGHQEAVELVDLISPATDVTTAGGDESGDFYQIKEASNQ